MNADLFRELAELLQGDGFTGQVVLHCNQGQVLKYEVSQVRRPGGEHPRRQDVSETRPPR